MTEAITEKSIQGTRICALASLLFLFKVQRAYDENHIAFFREDGAAVIRQCFQGVLPQNHNTEKMPQEFLEIIQDLDEEHEVIWPNNAHFGNYMNDLIDQYTTNVKTNLSTHAKKRLREYLRMKIYERRRGY